MAQKISWDQYATGEPHALTEDEIYARHGIVGSAFRVRLSKYCRRAGLDFTAYRKSGVLHFRIERT